MWRNVLKNEEMHLGRMTDDSFLKGYTSTTRDIGQARNAGDGSLGGAGTGPGHDLDFEQMLATEGAFGWVYAMRPGASYALLPRILPTIHSNTKAPTTEAMKPAPSPAWYQPRNCPR